MSFITISIDYTKYDIINVILPAHDELLIKMITIILLINNWPACRKKV